MAIVKIENLKKSYYISDKGVPILWDLNLEIGVGEIVSVEGSSGVGKSTLLNILGAMDEFDSGLVEVCGVNLGEINNTEKEKFRANKISFIFQHHLLLPDFTALENVMIPLLISKMNVVKAKQEATEMLGRVGLGERLTSFPSQLSGGESARVGVARALVSKKQLVLADEPTGNLDRETSKNLMALILNLQKELSFSMVLVTHDMELATMANRRNKMISGKLQPITA
ncbi:MAG: ABC transporter ATP-binding protein [Leptospiraceae bacterium]|nr:ABC transporter ATP-binding protein [Leptospiraceae bacterium]